MRMRQCRPLPGSKFFLHLVASLRRIALPRPVILCRQSPQINTTGLSGLRQLCLRAGFKTAAGHLGQRHVEGERVATKQSLILMCPHESAFYPQRQPA